ncbi:MAG: cupredoxin domain-containing protein [Nitrosotalea sp.]
MKFRWYYVAMGLVLIVVLGGTMYAGKRVCIPVEAVKCNTLVTLDNQGLVAAAPPEKATTVTTQPPAPATTTTSTIPKGTGGTVPPNENKVDFTLYFQISPDFSKYGFNGTIGSAGANPDIKVHAGDTVTVHLSNPTKSFHAFGVVIDPQNPSGVLWNSAFKTPDSPMKPGEAGQVTFVAGTPGLYHYICTVPGHAELGMNGNFIVEK